MVLLFGTYANHDAESDMKFPLLQNRPQGEILESNVTIGHNWCQDAGIYEVSLLSTISYDMILAFNISDIHSTLTQLYFFNTSYSPSSVHHGRHGRQGQGTLLLRLRVRGRRVEDLQQTVPR